MAHTKKFEQKKASAGSYDLLGYQCSARKWKAIIHFAFGRWGNEWQEAGALDAIRKIIKSPDSEITSDFLKKLDLEAAKN
jgi:hypothetical protein